jgi:hypothetical protein
MEFCIFSEHREKTQAFAENNSADRFAWTFFENIWIG